MRILSIFCLFWGLWTGVLAQVDSAEFWYLVGKMANENNDFNNGFKAFKRGAELGNFNSQVGLGVAYIAGAGVEKDISKGLFWTEKAAERGHIVAQNALGAMYLGGIEVEKDYKKAKKMVFNVG